jgi:hypothetical protein
VVKRHRHNATLGATLVLRDGLCARGSLSQGCWNDRLGPAETDAVGRIVAIIAGVLSLIKFPPRDRAGHLDADGAPWLPKYDALRAVDLSGVLKNRLPLERE